MRLIRIVVAMAILALVPVLTATAAHAELTGPCTGTGRINAVTINPKIQDSAVIPRAGEVHWRGTVAGAAGQGKRPIEGEVAVKLPWPMKQVVINNSWAPRPSAKYGNVGVYTYNLPAVLVGPKITVFGHHTERGKSCVGTIDVQLEGSKWKNPALIASLLFTVLALVNMWIVMHVKGRSI
jgi:hypothetical protein